MAADGRGAVKFTATHASAFVGSDITVAVTAGDKESIAEVAVTLDGELLEELELPDGTEDYTRSFTSAGQHTSGMTHTLRVEAVDASGVTNGATTEWSDS